MALRLDPPRRHGHWRVAVLCDVEVRAHPLGDGVFATGWKRPAAIIASDGEGVSAVDLRGRPLNLATLEDVCPGLLESFGKD